MDGMRIKFMVVLVVLKVLMNSELCNRSSRFLCMTKSKREVVHDLPSSRTENERSGNHFISRRLFFQMPSLILTL